MSLLLIAKVTLAAIVSINDTQFSSRALSGSSGSSGDSSHTSTYSGSECGYYSAATEAGCQSVLGVSSTSDYTTTSCDGGRYTCTCASSFSKTCDGADEYGYGASCKSTDDAKNPILKYKTCKTISTLSCADIQGEIVASQAACETLLGRSYIDGSYMACDDSGTEKHICAYPSCSALEIRAADATKTFSNTAPAQADAVQSGKCYLDAGLAVSVLNVWYCPTSYTENKVPVCTDSRSPVSCDLQTETLYKPLCEYPVCSAAQMTVMNNRNIFTTSLTSKSSCPSSGFLAGKSSSKCYIDKTSADTGTPNDAHLYNTCTCPSDYAYTTEDCKNQEGEIEGEETVPVVEKKSLSTFYTITSSSSNYSVTGLSYYDYCYWDAQNKGPVDKAFCDNRFTSGTEAHTNCIKHLGLSGGFDTAKFKFKTCRSKCPSAKLSELMEVSAAENASTGCAAQDAQVIHCAVPVSYTTTAPGYDADLYNSKIANVSISSIADDNGGPSYYSSIGVSNIDPSGFYFEKAYCSCPETYKVTCPAGTVPGGKECTAEDGVKKYQLCLPVCDETTEGKMITGNPSEDTCGGISQKYNPEGGDSDLASGKYFCANKTGTGTTYAKSTCASTSGTIKVCCLSNDTTTVKAGNCFNNFVPGGKSGSYQNCFPYGETPPTQACFKSDGGTEEAYWQCSCVNYKTDAECIALGTESGTEQHGAGTICTLEGKNNPKYQTCSSACANDGSEYIAAAPEECKLSSGTQTPYTACYIDGSETEQYKCTCPEQGFTSIKEHCEAEYTDPEEASTCQTYTIGLGTSCEFDAYQDNKTQAYLIKYEGFATRCSFYTKTEGESITVASNLETCRFGSEIINDPCYTDAGDLRYVCRCPDSYITLDDYCAGIVAAGTLDDSGQPYTLATCKSVHVGEGIACSFDVDPATKLKLDKFSRFSKRCPTDRPVFDSSSECSIDGSTPQYTICYNDNNQGVPKYVCTCPSSFDNKCYTADGAVDTTKIRGGTACNFESYDPTKIKYSECLQQCNNTSLTPVVSKPEDCPLVNGMPASVTEQCFNKFGDESKYYVCSCPSGYQTLEEYCSSTEVGGQTGVTYDGTFYPQAECVKKFTGIGIACTYDNLTAKKYYNFAIICPSNRPLFYSADECVTDTINGSIESTCYEKDNLLQQRVVCKCPGDWVDINGKDAGGNTVCTGNTEASGTQCSFEGTEANAIKYAQCYTKCDKLATNGKGITYIDEEEASEAECKLQLGEGATYGASEDEAACSRNHGLFYPCFCGADYTSQCLLSDNKHPKDDALACTVGTTTWYKDTECENNDCVDESSTVAVDAEPAGYSGTAEAYCQEHYGDGSTGIFCNVNGTASIQCSCDARTYTETCDYPYTVPVKKPAAGGKSWCKYGEGSTLMKNGQDHFKLGECKVKDLLAKCGEHILNSDGSENSSYTIKVTSTENECTTKYGTGAKTQLCEYSSDNNKRGYNCYYNLSEFPVTEATCPVRHVLSKQYIIENGVYHYKSCDCHPAYKYHKYNCAGMLSGGECTQTVSTDLDAYDETLEGQVGNSLTFYPYCQCTADYNQVCDGERNVGVGKPCNGKYIACECKPDDLPENWADNYYGCPGGAKPTGVIKPNGCGGKYYQCSVTECTWQHTEKCPSPLIGVDACQDNLGNIGGYKSCQVPSEWKICADDTIGKGEPLIYKGQYYYKECIDQGTCVHGETQTCQAEYLVGVNACTRNNVTYFEYCVCAKGFDKVCTEGQVGVGTSCKLNGTEYYTACETPTMACTADHKLACDTNQEKYDPCVKDNTTLMYKCRCPQNWESCSETGAAAGAETCTDVNGTVYSQCEVTATCSANQSLTYSVCTSSQKGMGGSCIEDGVIKYAVCEETSACRLNGYQYACLGFETSALGDDFCVDENGNKLYKECKCPESYVECPSKTNTKGTSCTPLNQNGSSGTTVYASCTCNDSIYKYDCQAADSGTGGNEGIIPAGKKSCTPVTYDSAKGEAVEGTTLYESCDCAEGYQYTCTGNGHYVEASQGYCQKYNNAAKLYKECKCEEKYSFLCTADESSRGTGLTAPKDESKACTPLGADTTTKYSECECGAQYNLTCEGNAQQPGNSYCLDEDGLTYYNACTCDTTVYQFDCKPSGANKGVTLPSIASDKRCLEQKYVNGLLTSTNRYMGCSCKAAYKFECYNSEATIVGSTEKYTSDKYKANTDDYCETAEVKAQEVTDSSGNVTTEYVTGDATRKYSKCECGDKYATACVSTGSGNPSDFTDKSDICIEVTSGGTVTKYNTEYCECVPSDMTDYTWVSSVNDPMSDKFKLEVQQTCNDYQNVEYTLDGCGKLYYRCLKEDWHTNESCTALTAKEQPSSVIKWVGTGTSERLKNSYGNFVTLYSDCGCPSSANLTDCDKYKETTHSELFCTDSPWHGSTYNGQNKKESCFVPSDAGLQAIVKPDENTLCLESDGTKKYQRCKCKEIYDASVSPGCMTKFQGDPSKAADDAACWENGVRKVTYNGGNALKDCSCMYPNQTRC